MSFVDTIVEQISKSGFENITKPQSFDMSDDTFAKLLEKQLSAQDVDNKEGNLLGELGMPADLTIEPYNPENTGVQANNNEISSNIDISDVEIKDFSIDNYLSDFMRNPAKMDSPLMNMAMKYATSMYGTQGKEFVENITELADGLAGVM